MSYNSPLRFGENIGYVLCIIVSSAMIWYSIKGDESLWLSGDAITSDEMKKILGPYPPQEMDAYPVSSRVNSPDADDEQLIRPLATL